MNEEIVKPTLYVTNDLWTIFENELILYKELLVKNAIYGCVDRRKIKRYYRRAARAGRKYIKHVSRGGK